MHDIPNRIADVLLELEASLRTHGKWDDLKPKASDLKSSIPFCMDTLKFEQWLQWIFLPTMKDTIEQTKPLPLKSAIFEAHTRENNSFFSHFFLIGERECRYGKTKKLKKQNA